ncbi:MAG: hypothetical protein AAGE94_02810 [Acidobacteriota bacterium]
MTSLWAPHAAATGEPPEPAAGDAPVATLALLYHQRDICDTIAGKVLENWPSAEMPVEQQAEAVQEYVLQRQLADLAAGRAAADLIDRFMPRAQQEATSGETASSLGRLAGQVRELCDTVALPVAPREQFEARIRGHLDRVAVETKELGRLLLVDDDERIEAALQPYLFPIQVAGIEAQGEYLAYLEKIRPKPKGPTMAEQMQSWHRTVYTPTVTPTKRAFGAYLKARNSRDAKAMRETCRRLSSQVIQLLRDDAAFTPPDDRVAEALRRIYIDMRSLGPHCAAGREQEVQSQLGVIQGRLRDAASQLQRYGLGP